MQTDLNHLILIRRIPFKRQLALLQMCLIVFFGGATTALPQEPLNAQILKEVEALVVQYPIDSDAGNSVNTKEQADKEKQRLNEIQTRLNLKPYLFALLDKHYRQIQSDGFPSILRAIALRDDLQDDELNIVTREMKNILDSSKDLKDYVKHDYLRSAVGVLKKHPSAEHEAIALKVLNYCKDITWMDMNVEAAETLAAIGTENALPSMIATSEWLNSLAVNSPAVGSRANRIQQALGKLRDRLK